MASTLSYGYVKPASGDRGSTFFPALEDNIQQLNDHNHDGENSALLSPSAISTTGFTTLVESTDWTNNGNGNFSFLVNVPAAVEEVNDYNLYFYDSAGKRLYLKAERASASTFNLYINTNIDVTVVYK